MAVASGAARLRVLTYNIFLRAPVFKEDQEARWDAFCAEHIENYDLILLQEAFTLNDQHMGDLSKKGWECVQFHKCPRWPLKFVGSGLAFVSRFPIVHSDTMIFRAAAIPDRFAAKGALYVQVKAPNGLTVHVLNTHLQAAYGAGQWERFFSPQSKAARVRRDQIQEAAVFLAKCIGMHADPSKDLILFGGDFNMDSMDTQASRVSSMSGSTEYAQLKSLLAQTLESFGDAGFQWIDTLLTSDQGRPATFPSFNGCMPQQSLDYLWVVSHEDAERKWCWTARVRNLPITLDLSVFINNPTIRQMSSLSDHLAVSCDFVLAPEAAADPTRP